MTTPTLLRRTVLGGLAGAVAAPAVLRAQALPSQTPFTLGVASGDPSPDGFVIWTRLAPDPLALHSGMRMKVETVGWEVAADEGFRQVVARGDAPARPELGHSVHVELAGLQPARPYWYRFTALGAQTGVGRARTLPAPGAKLDRVRFIAGGCQNYEDGYWTAYRKLSEEPDIDFFWHYGDYIYEGTGLGAPHMSHGALPVRRHWADEPYSLDDYRARYAQYKLDPDLQAAHAALRPGGSPGTTTRSTTTGPHATTRTAPPPDVFDLRRQAAAQAYYENMPLRARSFPHGTGRSRCSARRQLRRPAGRLVPRHPPVPRRPALRRQLQARLRRRAAARPHHHGRGGGAPGCSTACPSGRARWNLIGNQVMMMPLDRRKRGRAGARSGTWTPGRATRPRAAACWTTCATGASATWWWSPATSTRTSRANCATAATRGATLATEFRRHLHQFGRRRPGPEAATTPPILADNPHCPFINSQRGYMVHEVGRDHWRADFKVLDQIRARGGVLSTRKMFAVERGAPGLHAA